MRLVFSLFLIGLFALPATGTTYRVPDEELGITAIQQAVNLASDGDTVLVSNGVYDSLHVFQTWLGVRHAVVGLTKDIKLIGASRTGVVIDHAEAEYGIICQGVGRDALITQLTIVGGRGGRDDRSNDSEEDRFLTAAIACLEDASPTITFVDIEGSGTGIIVRPLSTNSAPRIERTLIARCSHDGIFIVNSGTETVEIDRVTLVDNFDYGLYVSNSDVSISNSALTHNGKYGISAYLVTPDVSYCNLYWNDQLFPDSGTGALNYGPSIGDLTGVNGNISAEPYYCDYFGTAGYNYSVCLSDPVSPHYQAGAGGVTIGAFGAVCTGCLSPVEPASWGAIKAIFR
jgi:hypothetical protein